MPIVGLTDNVSAEFVTVGRLRKGAKKNGNKPGADLEWFRFTSEIPGIEEAFYAAYPAEPTEVRVVLPAPTTDEVFSAWKEEWGGSLTLKHRCDGVHVVRRWNEKTGEYEDFAPGEGPECPGGCSITARLRLIIPELVAAGYVGEITFVTGSKHDITALLGSIKRIEQERHAAGSTLMWFPCVLKRVSQEVSSPAWEGEPVGKRHKVIKSLVKLFPSEEWVRAQVENTRQTFVALPPVIKDPEAVLKRNHVLLHGDGSDWDDFDALNGGVVDAETGEIIETSTNEPDEPTSEEVGHIKALREAMDHVTDGGLRLGDCDMNQLCDMQVWCDEHPGKKANELGAHVALLIDSMIIEEVEPETLPAGMPL